MSSYWQEFISGFIKGLRWSLYVVTSMCITIAVASVFALLLAGLIASVAVVLIAIKFALFGMCL